MTNLIVSHDKKTRSVNKKKTSLIRFVADTKLKGVINPLESEATIQSKLDRLEE